MLLIAVFMMLCSSYKPLTLNIKYTIILKSWLYKKSTLINLIHDFVANFAFLQKSHPCMYYSKCISIFVKYVFNNHKLHYIFIFFLYVYSNYWFRTLNHFRSFAIMITASSRLCFGKLSYWKVTSIILSYIFVYKRDAV